MPEIQIIGVRFINDIDVEFLIQWSDGTTSWLHEDVCFYQKQISDFFKRFEKSFKLMNRSWYVGTEEYAGQ